jgi:hypothetical protein
LLPGVISGSETQTMDYILMKITVLSPYALKEKRRRVGKNGVFQSLGGAYATKQLIQEQKSSIVSGLPRPATRSVADLTIDGNAGFLIFFPLMSFIPQMGMEANP